MTQGSKEVPETRKRDKQAVFQGLLLPRISRLKINQKYNITAFQEINAIVKYKNKNTGYVTVYESTSYYDPVAKQSRPKRKYLGHEDPITGELIRSSGQRGRRKSSPVQSEESGHVPTEPCDDLLASLKEKDKLIKTLKEENAALRSQLDELRASLCKVSECISPFLG